MAVPAGAVVLAPGALTALLVPGMKKRTVHPASKSGHRAHSPETAPARELPLRPPETA